MFLTEFMDDQHLSRHHTRSNGTPKHRFVTDADVPAGARPPEPVLLSYPIVNPTNESSEFFSLALSILRLLIRHIHSDYK